MGGAICRHRPLGCCEDETEIAIFSPHGPDRVTKLASAGSYHNGAGPHERQGSTRGMEKENTTPHHGAGKTGDTFVTRPPIPRLENHEILEWLDTQKESEGELRSGDRGHIGECTGTVAEVGECGNRKKMNSE